MQLIKVDFSDFWAGFYKEDNYFINLLKNYFEIELSDEPDLLIYSCYGYDHLKYKCHKLFYCGENMRVNWNACDFALSSDYLKHDRYQRMPHWMLYEDPLRLIKSGINVQEILKAKTGFCSFIVGNPKAKKRIDFFNKLAKYKKVDSGGSFMNNVGKVYSQLDKMDFIKKYKFTIAFENSSYPGYTTEKLFQAMLADCIPIYWGDPWVAKEFNTASFINYENSMSDEEVIERIIAIDNDDELYFKMLQESWYVNNKVPESVKEENIVEYFRKIFIEIEKIIPVSITRKGVVYNWQVKLEKADRFLNSRFKYRKSFR